MGFELGAALHRVETSSGISPLLGRRVFDAVTAGQAGLGTALTHVNEAHRRVVDLADRLGIPPSAYGEQTPPDEERRFGQGG